jgi:hypothetical protein
MNPCNQPGTCTLQNKFLSGQGGVGRSRLSPCPCLLRPHTNCTLSTGGRRPMIPTESLMTRKRKRRSQSPSPCRPPNFVGIGWGSSMRCRVPREAVHRGAVGDPSGDRPMDRHDVAGTVQASPRKPNRTKPMEWGWSWRTLLMAR